MGIRIGTKVRFLNAVGGGVVKDFSGDKFALVETEDGFDMPVLVTDLIEDTSASYDAEDREVKKEEETIRKGKQPAAAEITFEQKKFAAFAGNLYMAFVPENEQILRVSHFHLYLINDSNYYLNYVISFRDNNVWTHILSGEIEPDTKFDVSGYSQTDLSKIKEFRIQGLFYKYGLFEPVAPVDQVFSIEKINFNKSQFFKENEYFHQKALILKEESHPDEDTVAEKLKDVDWAEVISQKEKSEKKKGLRSPVNPNLREVDLHIEELVDDESRMSNAEILNIQLSAFKSSMEDAMKDNMKKIVFIHGVGNGVLKHELRKKLDKEYPELRYQDASFKEYGFGATMVYL
jgi:hypothetical protein